MCFFVIRISIWHFFRSVEVSNNLLLHPTLKIVPFFLTTGGLSMCRFILVYPPWQLQKPQHQLLSWWRGWGPPFSGVLTVCQRMRGNGGRTKQNSWNKPAKNWIDSSQQVTFSQHFTKDCTFSGTGNQKSTSKVNVISHGFSAQKPVRRSFLLEAWVTTGTYLQSELVIDSFLWHRRGASNFLEVKWGERPGRCKGKIRRVSTHADDFAKRNG